MPLAQNTQHTAMTGQPAVVAPGTYSSFIQRSPLQQLVSLHTFSHRFTRPLAGRAAATITEWAISATDNLNIAAGFDPYFKLTAAASSTTVPTTHGLLITSGTTDADDIIVLPHTVDADNLISGLADVSGLSLEDNHDIWLNWIVYYPTSIILLEQVECYGTMTDPASALTETNDQDFCLFRRGTFAGSANARFYVDMVKDGGTVATIDTGIDAELGGTYVLTLRYRASDSKIEAYINRKLVGVTAAAYRTADDAGVSVHFTPVALAEVSTAATTDAAKLCPRAILIDVDLET